MVEQLKDYVCLTSVSLVLNCAIKLLQWARPSKRTESSNRITSAIVPVLASDLEQ